MNITILTTDTIHHRFFISKINEFHTIGSIFLERRIIEPKYDNKSPFEEQEKEYEQKNFDFKDEYPKCPLFEFESMNDKNAFSQMKNVNPELGIVFGTGKLNDHVIESFPLLMNVHRGIPEYYRGIDSDLWAIKNKDYENIGTTIHEVESDLDTGKIIAQEYLKLEKNMKVHHIRYHTTLIAVNLCIEAIDKFSRGKLELRPQKNKGEYFSFMCSKLKKKMEYQFNSHCSNL